MTPHANDGSFTNLERDELAKLPDSVLAEAFRDIAARNYSAAYASLFRAHVIETARRIIAKK